MVEEEGFMMAVIPGNSAHHIIGQGDKYSASSYNGNSDPSVTIHILYGARRTNSVRNL